MLGNKYIYIMTAFLMVFIIMSGPVNAQGMNNNAWSPQVQNRASIAALIRDVEENGRGSSSGIASGGGNVTQLVCGGEGDATAKGNSSCIILNNADASIDLGQDSTGDQTATNEDITNVDETINTGGSEADEVLAVLNGE